jgi:UDP-glucose 4-epimerase
MRVLVIGGSGFIGSHLVDVFLERGLKVTVFDHHREKFRPPIPEVQFVQGEMGNRRALEEVLAEGVDRVILLASTTIPQTSNDDPSFDVQANLVTTLTVLDLCVKYKVKKVIFSSSGGTVYGMPKCLPISEEHPTNPICSYGIVKLAIEKYLYLYHHLFGLQYVSLRLANPYGIRQDPTSAQGIISVFAARILQKKPLTVWGDGRTIRDFIHIRDVAELYYRVLSSEVMGVFNVGSGVGVTINDLLKIIPAQLGLEPTIIHEAPRRVDVPAIILDCARAKAAFLWDPQVSLEKGIAELAKWLRAQGIDTRPMESMVSLSQEYLEARLPAVPGHSALADVM